MLADENLLVRRAGIYCSELNSVPKSIGVTSLRCELICRLIPGNGVEDEGFRDGQIETDIGGKGRAVLNPLKMSPKGVEECRGFAKLVFDDV